MTIKEKILLGIIVLVSFILWGIVIWHFVAPKTEGYIKDWQMKQAIDNIQAVRKEMDYRKIMEVQKCMEDFRFNYCLDKVK